MKAFKIDVTDIPIVDELGEPATQIERDDDGKIISRKSAVYDVSISIMGVARYVPPDQKGVLDDKEEEMIQDLRELVREGRKAKKNHIIIDKPTMDMLLRKIKIFPLGDYSEHHLLFRRRFRDAEEIEVKATEEKKKKGESTAKRSARRKRKAVVEPESSVAAT